LFRRWCIRPRPRRRQSWSGRSAQQYVYPITSALRNRLGIRQAAALTEREATLSVIRIAQLDYAAARFKRD
jgi:fido (protein-threonine AMPylation protein)